MTKLFLFNAPVNRSQTKEIWENVLELELSISLF